MPITCTTHPFHPSSIHCLCSSCIIRLFSTHFPRSIFVYIMQSPASTLSCHNRWSLLGWKVSVCVLQRSHFSDNRPVITQDWVGESSGGEKSNMRGIRRGRIVCDLCSHVDMNLTAFCSHCLSISLPPCPYFPTPVTSQLGIVASMRSRLPISWTSRTNTADLVSSFVLANEMLVNGIDILYEASDPGTAFDSQGHYDRRCFPGTREQYIADITNWVTESANPPSSMYWMRGPAGVGKSAIAQTCAKKLKETGHLGAALSRNTTIPYVCSLPSLSNLRLRFLIIMPLSLRGSPRIEVLLRRKFHFNSDCWADSGAREAGKEGTTKSCLYRWIGRVCGQGRTSRNYQDNRILCQGEIYSIPLDHLQPRWTSHRSHIQPR